jgi:hypothetical protein
MEIGAAKVCRISGSCYAGENVNTVTVSVSVSVTVTVTRLEVLVDGRSGTSIWDDLDRPGACANSMQIRVTFAVSTSGSVRWTRKGYWADNVRGCVRRHHVHVRVQRLGSQWVDFHESLYRETAVKSVNQLKVRLESDDRKRRFTWRRATSRCARSVR